MRITSSLTVTLFLLMPTCDLAAEDPGTVPAVNPLGLTAEEQRELDRLLELTLLQQKARAKELIEARPDTKLAATLQRLLDEYDEFDRIEEAERRERATISAWNRDYWRSRCCPPPQWSPPVGRIENATDGPILYQVRLPGLERSAWMGPHRLQAGASYAAPQPFEVRYITREGMQQRFVVPGESFTFRFSPSDQSVSLTGVLPVPAAAEPMISIVEARPQGR